MTRTSSRNVANEMVPLADRLRWMRFLRLAMVLAVAALVAFSPEVFRPGALGLAAVTGGYVAIALSFEGAWHLFGRRGITLFGSLIILDGFYLAWVCFVSGGIASPVRYLMVLHLIAVVLLASYRTGLKVALWDSLLTMVVYYARDVRMTVTVGGRPMPDSAFHRMVTFVAVFWLVALATAAFSAVNERELRRRKYDLEALARLAAGLDGASGGREAAEILTEHVAETFDFDCVVLVGENQGRWSTLAHHGPVATGDFAPPLPGGSVLARAIDSKQTLLASALTRGDDAWLTDLLPGGRNLVVVPLYAEGHCHGVLVAEHAMRHGSRIERRVVSMLERFASHGALALGNAWLLERVQKMASTDGLTGVANRRAFDATLDRELGRAERGGEPVSLVMLDIDDFKGLNDLHGHQMGDDVLRSIAAEVSGACRTYDTVARYGGEEFAVILPGCTQAESLMLAERLREVVVLAGAEVRVTASVGVATYPVHASDAQELIQAADGALYVSKRSGRNRVSQAPGRPVSEEAAV